MSELPLVIINVQRGGPSTGMPTKTEQSDLLQALYCRNGESPIVVIAPSSPADCFDLAVEAVRIAVKYMTPVIYLSDGNIANAAEPWPLPKLEDMKPIEVSHPVASKTGAAFLPYSRDPETLARPWAIPGTPGLEHRIGGLAKADLTGNVSYDPDNNQKMINYRAEKIQKVVQDIPDIEVSGKPSGKLLIASWGGTYGAVYQTVRKLQASGVEISHIHLKYLNPFPKNLGSILEAFDQVLLPELNMGQLIVLLRHFFPKGNFSGYNKVTGQPFSIDELDREFRKYI